MSPSQDPYRRAAQEQADAEALVAQQQRTAERLANAQAKQAAREQKAAADAARKAALSEQELKYRAMGMIPVTTADGNLHPDPLWDQKQAAKAAKEQAAAAKVAQEQENATAIDKARTSGRRFVESKLTGQPIYLQSQEDLEAQRAAKTEELRKKSLDDQIKAAIAERDFTVADKGYKPLPQKARDEGIPSAISALENNARLALQTLLMSKTNLKLNDNDWIPFNEAPSPEAQTAKQRLERLADPNTPLDEQDLADLEANDATKPLLAKIKEKRELLAKDKEASDYLKTQNRRIRELALRRDAPEKWAELTRTRRAQMSPEELEADLTQSAAEIEQRDTALSQRFAGVQAKRAATGLQIDQLRQQAAERRSAGIPAGEVVTFTSAGGTTEHWPRDLAEQFERLQAQQADDETQMADELAAIQAEHADLQRTIDLHNESATALQTQQQTSQQQASTSAKRRLQFTPGLEQTAAEIDALRAEHEQRASVLAQDGSEFPEEARAALDQDIQSRMDQTLAAGQARIEDAAAALDRIRQRQPEGGDLSAAWTAEAENLSVTHGISMDEATRLLSDLESASDWDSAMGRHNEGDKPGATRLLSNGGIAVNPSITEAKAYEEAVAKSGGSPEAQADAMERYPQIREAAGQQVLESIKEIGSVFGESSVNDWKEFAKTKPADVSEGEWAMRFTEKMKADANSGTFGRTIASMAREAWLSLNQGAIDQRAFGSGLLAGLTGSETLMQDAQWANRKSQALQSVKDLSGDQSKNFLAAGLASQLPRLAGSTLGPALAAKGVSAGVRLFAGTKLGAKFLPSLAAAVAKAPTPAQAVKAIDTLTRAGEAGAAVGGATQTYGAQIADIYSTLRREHPDLDHTTALKQAQMPAVASAIATAALTALGGSSGVERLFTRPQEARQMLGKAFATQLQRLGFVGKEFAKGGMKETVEESLDELASQIATAVGTGHSVQQAVADYLQQLPEMAVATMVMGGAGEGITAAQQSSVDRTTPTNRANLPEAIARAEAAIDNFTLPGLDDTTREQAQRRAALVLSLAQGGELFDVEEGDLNAAGWTREGDTFKPLKDYTGPQVLDIDKGGLPVIKDSYVQSLRDNGLAAVADAIPATETQTRNRYAQQQTAPLQGATSQTPAGPQQSRSAPAQSPALPSVGNANTGAVQTPAGTGTQPPRSGNPAPQSGAPVASPRLPISQSPSLDSTTPPTTEKAIADWLVDRYMPDQDAAAAAKAIASHPDMAGKSFDEFNKMAGTQRDAILDSLGITGSKAKSKAQQDPLRFTPSTGSTPSIQSNQPKAYSEEWASRATWEQLVLAKQEIENNEAEWSKGDGMSHQTKVGMFNAKGIIEREMGKRPPSQRFNKNVDQNPKAQFQPAKPTGNPPLSAGKTQPKPSAEVLAKAQAAIDDSIEGTPEHATAVSRLAYLHEKHLVADLAPAKAAVQAKEMTEAQATQEAAKALQAIGKPVTHTNLRQALELGLGWNTTRSNVAAHNHLGTKDQSETPLATSDRADTANRPQPTPFSPSGTDPSAARMGPDLSIKSKSPLRKNSAYSRAKLLTLARIKDPAKKAWARQAFAAMEDSLQRHHALYDAIAVGPAAVRRLNGSMTAVEEIDGRITRLLDLDAIVANFDYLGNPADAIRATGIEEDIHAVVLRLARTQPEKYSPEAIRRQWRKLPQILRAQVWQAYDYGRTTMPAKLTAAQEYHMQNEFLRMLVQDKAFAGAITETVDTPATLVQWVRDLLRDLAKTLRDMMGLVDAPLRAELEGMVDQITAQLRLFDQKSRGNEDRLATLDYLRDPAGIALQAMQSGVLFDHLAKTDPSLSPEAMARAFDLLTPELKSIAYRSYRSTLPVSKSPRPKVPKSDLLRHLLTAMTGDAMLSREVQSALLGASTRSTNLLSRLFSRLTSHVSPQPAPDLLTLLKQQPEPARKTLASLHARLLRAADDLAGAQFVQSMPGIVQDIFTAAPADRHEAMIAALRQGELRAQAEGKPLFQGAIPGELLAELRRLAYAAGEANADLAQSPNATPAAAAELRRQLIEAERTARAERESGLIPTTQDLADQSKSFTSSVKGPGRVLSSSDIQADNRAALEDQKRREIGALENSSPAARAALKRRLRAQQYAAERLRERSRAELADLEAKGRLPLPIRLLVEAILTVASGRYEGLKPGYFKLAGTATENTLQRLGIRIQPQTGRLFTNDPVNTTAYVERGHIILRQEALDDLDVLAPITRQLIRMTERQVRQHFNLPVTGPEPTTESTASEEEKQDIPSLSEGTADTPVRSDSPSSENDALTRTPTPAAAPTREENTPETAPSIRSTRSIPSPPTTRIPLGGKLSLPAQFASQDDLDAFQYQLDRESLLRESTSTAVRRKATERIQSLRARLIDDTGASKEEIEQRLADYHRAVIEAAKKADPVETFRPTPFHAFASGTTEAGDTTLPAPIGGDIISGMKGQGIRRLGPPDASDGWAWYRELKADAAKSKLKPREAARAAKAGELDDSRALLAWVDSNIVATNGGRSIDEAAAELAESDDQQFPVASGDELGRAIMDAIAARLTARDAAPDPIVQAEKQAIQQGGDFRAVAEGAPGQPFTGRTLAARVQTGDEIQIGSEWLTVTDLDAEEGTVALDSDRYGPQQIDPDQTVHLRAIGDEVLATTNNQEPKTKNQEPSSIHSHPTLTAAADELRAAMREAGMLAAADRTYLKAIEKAGLQPAIRIKGQPYTGTTGMWHPEILGHYVWKNVFTPQQRRDDPLQLKAGQFAMETWMDSPGSGFDDFGFLTTDGQFLDREAAFDYLEKRGLKLPESSWSAQNRTLDSSDLLSLAASSRDMNVAIRVDGVLQPSNGVTHSDLLPSPSL